MSYKEYFSWYSIRFINKKKISIERDILPNRLICVPAAPAFVENYREDAYYNSLRDSDFCVIDSSLFAILCRLSSLKNYKYSGYLLICDLLKYLSQTREKIFLVDPSEKIACLNKSYLLERTKLNEEDIKSYVAPFYKKGSLIEDKALLQAILDNKPRIIVLGIAGGKQEILGSYLKNNIPFETTILCTGAALSFFTGAQVTMNRVFDRLRVGWLIRILDNPKVFLPRYLRAFKFIRIFFKHSLEIQPILLK